MSYKVFISHKNEDESNETGHEIGNYLMEECDYKKEDIFFDKISLEGGMNWRSEIINRLLASEVVIVILDTETVESDWVQREIDMARARNISILPVTLKTEYKDIEKSLSRFDLKENQFIGFPSGRSTAKIRETIKTISERIPKLAQKTISSQQTDYDTWMEKRKVATKKNRADSTSNLYVFAHPKNPELKFHLATGDSSTIRDFDILVNTENNYMQMARFYETNTLSWVIRTKGAYFDGEMLIEDTIQDELHKQAVDNARLPVPQRHVLVTSTGHKLGELKRFTDYRYVLHAASVEFDLLNRKVRPSGEVTRIIMNCIKKVDDIDRKKGRVGTGKEIFVEAKDDYKPLESILFPAFGAGNGGRKLAEAADEIIAFFARTDIPNFIEHMELSLNKIGFTVYFEEDIQDVVNIFNKYGFVTESVPGES
ncbi:MAG: toll/interleukin-1 receptor domain-containing protein [Chloroflexota bacterium]